MLEDFGQDEDRSPSGKVRSGCLTSCLGAVALLALILIGSAVYLHAADAPPKALHLSEAELVGTWNAPGGGTLTLRSDGTFSAAGVCGFGTSNPQVGSDSGTWKVGNGADWPYSSARATDSVILLGITGQNELDEGGDNNLPVLWQYVGPPDDSDTFCKLHK